MAGLLPLLHLHDLVPVEAAHLQLPVEVPHRERHEVLVRDAALQGDILEQGRLFHVMDRIRIISYLPASCTHSFCRFGTIIKASRPSPSDTRKKIDR